MLLGVGFEESKFHIRPKFSISLSLVCLSVGLSTRSSFLSSLPLTMPAAMLPAITVMDSSSETVNKLPVKYLLYWLP